MKSKRVSPKPREWWAYDSGLTDSGQVLMGFAIRNSPWNGDVPRIRVREVLPRKKGKKK